MASEETDATYAYVIFAIFSPFFIVTSVILYRSRHMYIIKARGPTSTVLAQNFLIIALFMFGPLRLLVSLCGLAVIVGVLANLTGCLFCLRSVVLIFRYRIARSLAQMEHVTNPNERLKLLLEGEDSWFITHRWLIRKKYMGAIYACFGVLFSASPLVITFALPTCEAKVAFVVFYAAGIALIWLVVALWLSRQMKYQRRDAFGFIDELKWAFAGSLLAAVGGPVILYTGNGFTFQVITYFIGMLVVYTATTIWPLYTAHYGHTEQAALDFAGLKDISNLSDLLSIDIGYASFMAYISREFAQENLLFWASVDNLGKKYGKADHRALLRRSECLAEAQIIIDQFIVVSAPLQINISDGIRKGLLEHFQAEKEGASMGGKSNGNGDAVRVALTTTASSLTGTVTPSTMTSATPLPASVPPSPVLAGTTISAALLVDSTDSSSHTSLLSSSSSSTTSSSSSSSSVGMGTMVITLDSSADIDTATVAPSSSSAFAAASSSSLIATTSSSTTVVSGDLLVVSDGLSPPSPTHTPTHSSSTPTGADGRRSFLAATVAPPGMRRSLILANPLTSSNPPSPSHSKSASLVTVEDRKKAAKEESTSDHSRQPSQASHAHAHAHTHRFLSPARFFESLRSRGKHKNHASVTADVDSLLTTYSIVALFQPAVEQVYTLMNNDVLPRYLKSEEFKGFVEAVKQRFGSPHHSKHRSHDDESSASHQHSSLLNGEKHLALQRTIVATGNDGSSNSTRTVVSGGTINAVSPPVTVRLDLTLGTTLTPQTIELTR